MNGSNARTLHTTTNRLKPMQPTELAVLILKNASPTAAHSRSEMFVPMQNLLTQTHQVKKQHTSVEGCHPNMLVQVLESICGCPPSDEPVSATAREGFSGGG